MKPEWWLVGVGIITFGVIAWQAWETRRSASAARDSIVMTHRPKIIVRELYMPEATELFKIGNRHTEGVLERIIADAVRRLEKFSADTTIVDGSFRLTNKGTNRATTQLVEAVIYVGDSLPPENPCFGKTVIDKQLKMAAGTTTRIDFKPITLSTDERSAIRDSEAFIYGIGKIIYVDELGNPRRTGFARRFSMKTGRFDILKDEPDYEYVD
jgi:hypothetical protein